MSKYKLRAAKRVHREVEGLSVTVFDKFAVYRPPADTPPEAWLKHAKQLAEAWSSEKTGIQLVIVPPGAELDVLEVVDDERPD
jgi:hypothetical protein